MTEYPRVIIAGTNSRAGKTTLTTGLILALKKRGLKVQPFKSGPDYIDPSFHTLAAKRGCRNLDAWMLPKDAVLELFARQANLSDISVIEGAMGLYDGISDREDGSSAHLAKILDSPVILVLDSRSLSRSAAAVALGYKEFDKEVDLRGVILNNIGSPSHYRGIKNAIKEKSGLPVLGFLPKDSNLTLPERHLGLIPAVEKRPLAAYLKRLSNLIETHIDLRSIIAISKSAKPLPFFRKRIFIKGPLPRRVNIALAKDAAFNFYYQDNLDILRHYGANLIEFSPLKDKNLPEGSSGIYLGGGFPELFSRQLSANTPLRRDILKRAKGGMPIYAECGGLIYLMKGISGSSDRVFPMAGVFDYTVKMGKKPAALGYVNIGVIKNNILSKRGSLIRGHAFHWSYLTGSVKKTSFAYKISKDSKPTQMDGFLKQNVLASYAHLHFGSQPDFARSFIQSCENYAKNK